MINNEDKSNRQCPGCEKTFLASLAMGSAGVCMLCSRNYALSASCFAGVVSLLAISGLFSLSSRIESFMRSWFGLTVWMAVSMGLINLGGVLFSAKSYVLYIVCMALGFANFWMVVMGLAFAVDNRFIKGRPGARRAIIFGIAIGACVLAICFAMWHYPAFRINVGCFAISAFVWGGLVWQRENRASLFRFKNVIVYPTLAVLMLFGSALTVYAVRTANAKSEARRESVNDSEKEGQLNTSSVIQKQKNNGERSGK